MTTNPIILDEIVKNRKFRMNVGVLTTIVQNQKSDEGILLSCAYGFEEIAKANQNNPEIFDILKKIANIPENTDEIKNISEKFCSENKQKQSPTGGFVEKLSKEREGSRTELSI